jgi:hypothetical protein
MLAAGLEFLVSIDFFAMADTGAPHGVDEVGAPARSEDLSRLHWRLRRAISEGSGHSPGLFRFVCLLAEEWPKAVINWLCAGICKAPRFMRFPWLCRSGLSRARRHEKCVISMFPALRHALGIYARHLAQLSSPLNPGGERHDGTQPTPPSTARQFSPMVELLEPSDPAAKQPQNPGESMVPLLPDPYKHGDPWVQGP